MNQVDLADTTYVAALPNFDSISNTIFTLLGTVVFVILVVRIVVAYGKQQWGTMVTEVLAALFALWFVIMPDNAKKTISDIVRTIFGG